MQNREAEKDEFFRKINGLIFLEEEAKELRGILIQIEQINRLINETQQKRSGYNYFKKIMLPSDYRRIRADLTTQVDYKVQREIHQMRLQLQERGKTKEEIYIEMKRRAEELYKYYKVRKSKDMESWLENEIR